MDERPNFMKIALSLVREPPDMFIGDQPIYHGEDGAFSADKQCAAEALAEQLRLAWNARGAADIKAKHDAFRVDVGLGGELADIEDQAIKNLDC